MNPIYFIDGNNLLHKVKRLDILMKKDKQSARESLVHMLLPYFSGKKISVTVFFDGFQNAGITASPLSIKYSNKESADKLIKDSIGFAKNARNITLISDDLELVNFARKCSASVIGSNTFSKELQKPDASGNESNLINSLSQKNDEFIKLFS